MFRLRVLALCLLLAGSAAFAASAPTRELPLSVYAEKVYGSWLGQCVGNMYGLAHENRYIDEPYGLVEAPTHYAPAILRRMRAADGVFSDDDTDIEYMYLFMMEEKGPEPSYHDLTERWMRHVWHHVWVANRSARALMAHGYRAPVTGMREFNRDWFQIDPQLVNEIWAVVAPGMVAYAARKSDWAARVTNDDYGTHPTLWYGAMYAEAFFESDVRRLYDLGMEQVPPGRFRDALRLCKLLVEAHPDDWKAARRMVRDMYYTHEPKETKSIVAAVLNGAMGALALLYGEGDFQKTLNYACMLGMDADNQAATLCGLLGIVHGPAGIPRSLLFPPEFPEWKKPLNDVYRNRTREFLPDGSLTDIAARTVELGKRQVALAGGRVEGDRLIIATDARFVAPLEVGLLAPSVFDLGEKVDARILAVGGYGTAYVTEIQGKLPPGLSLHMDRLVGRPSKAGDYTLKVVMRDGREPSYVTTARDLSLLVLGENLAPAAEVIAAVTQPTGGGAKTLSVINNRVRSGEGQSYDSFDGENSAEEDWYGLLWDSPQRLSRLRYVQGALFNNGGAWRSLTVQYLGPDGAWREAEGVRVEPLYLDNDRQEPFCGFWPYMLTFDSVETKGIRIYGKPGGSARFTSIAELEAYEE